MPFHGGAMGKGFAKLRAASGDAAAHRSEFDVQDIRNFFIRQALDVAEHNGDALLSIEGIKRSTDVSVQHGIRVQFLGAGG